MLLAPIFYNNTSSLLTTHTVLIWAQLLTCLHLNCICANFHFKNSHVCVRETRFVWFIQSCCKQAALKVHVVALKSGWIREKKVCVTRQSRGEKGLKNNGPLLMSTVESSLLQCSIYSIVWARMFFLELVWRIRRIWQMFPFSVWCLMGIIHGNCAKTFFSIRHRTRTWMKIKLTWFFVCYLYFCLVLLIVVRSGSAWIAEIMGRGEIGTKE